MEAGAEYAKISDSRSLWVKLLVRTGWTLVFAAMCGLIFYHATRDDVLPVTEISVNGDFAQLNVNDLTAVISEGVEGNFFTLSVAKLYAKFIAMPWVEQVWIHRVWPDKIRIDILEQTPVAIWNGEGLINENGELFHSDYSTFRGRLPEFVVNTRYKTEVIRWHEEYEKILRDYGLNINKFELDDRKNQTLYLSNNIQLELGRVETAQRLIRFLKVFKSNLYREQQRIKTVDLRYSNGFSIAWNN